MQQEKRSGWTIKRGACFGATLTVLVLSPLRLSLAEPVPGPAIDVSGNFDVQAVGHNAAVRDNNFEVGQLAVNLASKLGTRLDASVQIAYNLDEDVDIGRAFVDFNVFRWDGEPRRESPGVLDAGLRVGRFDVPFGIDWRVYSSVDRKLVSIPMVVANTHRGWNDVGVQFYGTTTWSNWSVYAVNGFGSSPALRLPGAPSTPPLVAGTGDAASFADNLPVEAFGGRGGIVINDNFEFGTSFGASYTDNNRQEQQLYSFDLTGRFTHLELKGEFISHKRFRTTSDERVFGYYMQGAYEHGNFFGVVRQDTYHADGSTVYPFNVPVNGTIFSTSFGGGYHVGPNAQLRLEYQLAEGSSNNTVFLQTAVAF